jgi:hypothetical protein
MDTSRSSARDEHRFGYAVKRLVLLTLVVACTVNVWTGAPLLALWVGARLDAASGHLTVPGLGAICATLAAAEYMLLRLLQWLSAAYERLTGRPRPRRRPAWLLSLRDSTGSAERGEREMNAVDVIVVLSVIVVMLAFEVWFWFFAGSPLAGGH